MTTECLSKEIDEDKMGHAIQKTEIYKLLKQRNSQFVATIDKVVLEVATRLANIIPKLFPEYTLHDIEHSVRIVDYMYELISDVDKFNDFELALMVFSAIFHDVGMSLGKGDIDEIKNNKYFDIKEINYHSYEKLYGSKAIEEIVRKKHADVSALIIEKEYKTDLILDEPRGASYHDDICILCACHTKDYSWMKDRISNKHKLKGKYSYNLLYLAHLLRIADLLDIDQSRTPYELYRLIDPEGVGNDEWRQHYAITNSKKVEEDRNTKKRCIVFYGKCEDIKIHRKLLNYIEWINNELEIAIKSCDEMDDEKYYLDISNKVSTHIDTVGYTVSDYKLSLDFKEITKLLMGENIYGDKKLGLRELIQNSIDACLVRKELERGKGNDFRPEVRIVVDEYNKLFVIKDNGVGMSESIIKNHFLKIGKSFYRSDAFKLHEFSYQPIGTYGIGFLACFMLSEDVVIETRYHEEPNKHTIQLSRGDEYISFNTVQDIGFGGTEIKLVYEEVMQIFGNNIENVRAFLNKYFITDYYELVFIHNEKREIVNHSIREDKKEAKADIVIDVSKYMSDIEGVICLKNRRKFIREIQDLDYISDYVFLCHNGGVTQDEIAIKEIIDKKNCSMRYLQLPVYDEDGIEDFEKAVEILDDIDEAIEKYVPDNYIYIFFYPEEQKCLEKKYLYDKNDPDSYGNVSISNVIKMSGIDGMCPLVNVIEVNLMEDEKYDVLVPYDKIRRLWFDREKIYLRNVFINNYFYETTSFANTISLEYMRLNILNNNIFPDVSRNQLKMSSKDIVDNTVTLVIHMAAIEEFGLNHEEQEIMKKFIKSKLGYGNALIKQELFLKYI